ncbi:MAG: DUF4388 domain-containing protein [Gemmatimonadota bacterium]
MSETAANAAPSVPPAREGEIRSDTIPHLFHHLCVARATGVLTVDDLDLRKTVQFRDGRVQFAGSNDRNERLCQFLLKENVIALADLLKTLEICLSTRDRVGEILVRRKLMSPADVERWVKRQVEEIVYSLFDWTRGHHVFAEKPICDESITLDLSGDAVVAEGVRRMRSWARAYEQVGGLNSEYRATRDMPVIIKGLPIRPEERRLLEMCDEAPTSLGEMCEASSLGDYEVCQAVWWLLIVGALMKS